MVQIPINVFDCLKRIFNYSFKGAMVGKGTNIYLSWNDLGEVERLAYKDEDAYNAIIELFKC